MKASENLMIGDWVMSTLGRPQPIKVYAIGNNFIDLRYGKIEQYGILALCDFEPIPITEKILELNGFIDRGNAGYQRLKKAEGDKHLTYYFSNGMFADGIPQIDEEINLLHGIRYVHELQHAMRICGVVDFADNFKVL